MANRASQNMSSQLIFDGKEDKYDIWEIRFLSHLHSLKLKDTILHEPGAEGDAVKLAEDLKRNEDCYAELVRCIDDKSLSLIRHDAPGDGRKALNLLKEHYSGRSKPRIISLYATLSRLRMGDNETVTDYLIRAEDAISALRDAGEAMSEGLCIAMILEGLPDFFKPLVVHVTQNEDSVTFTDFKRRLRNYEEAERRSAADSTDNVMKTATRQGRGLLPKVQGITKGKKQRASHVTGAEEKDTKRRAAKQKCGAITARGTTTPSPCAEEKDKTMPEKCSTRMRRSTTRTTSLKQSIAKRRETTSHNGSPRTR